MHTQNPSHWKHQHVFDPGNQAAERGTRAVMWITAATMLLEIWAGWWFNSMALLADGWHMSSHAVAIGMSAVAYGVARKYAGDTRFAFGTWKIEVLSGFASAIFLLGVAAMMVIASIERIVTPQPIRFQEAAMVAAVGLAVNLLCAWILGSAHHGTRHGHGHGHAHTHGHDLNLRSAYLHVIADAATSVLAIIALLGAWLLGWLWLDPVLGIVGAVLVALWAKGLVIDTAKVLLDREMDHPVVDEIRQVVESESKEGKTLLADLHVWRVGKNAFSCAMAVVTPDPKLTPDVIRRQLSVHDEIVHSTIEVHCIGEEVGRGVAAGACRK